MTDAKMLADALRRAADLNEGELSLELPVKYALSHPQDEEGIIQRCVLFFSYARETVLERREAADLLEQQAAELDKRDCTHASFVDVLNTELREVHANAQAEMKNDLRPVIRLLVDAARASEQFQVRKTIERQAEQLAQAEAALRAVEWEPFPISEDAGRFCPWCGAPESKGHEPDCPRQAALAALARKEQPK